MFQDPGSHWVMNIATGACMHKDHCWSIPITQTVINTINSLTELQGYTLLKLLGKNKTQLLQGIWDKDEEYIFDDGYKSNNSYNNEEEDDNLNCFQEIDETKVEALQENAEHENNKNNKSEANNEQQNEEENVENTK